MNSPNPVLNISPFVTPEVGPLLYLLHRHYNMGKTEVIEQLLQFVATRCAPGDIFEFFNQRPI